MLETLAKRLEFNENFVPKYRSYPVDKKQEQNIAAILLQRKKGSSGSEESCDKVIRL